MSFALVMSGYSRLGDFGRDRRLPRSRNDKAIASGRKPAKLAVVTDEAYLPSRRGEQRLIGMMTHMEHDSEASLHHPMTPSNRRDIYSKCNDSVRFPLPSVISFHYH